METFVEGWFSGGYCWDECCDNIDINIFWVRENNVNGVI